MTARAFDANAGDVLKTVVSNMLPYFWCHVETFGTSKKCRQAWSASRASFTGLIHPNLTMSLNGKGLTQFTSSSAYAVRWRAKSSRYCDSRFSQNVVEPPTTV